MLGRDRSYLVKKHSDSTIMFSETDIINLLEFLIDNIFAMLVDEFSNIPTDINCVPFLADVFLYSHDADCIQGLLKKNI